MRSQSGAEAAETTQPTSAYEEERALAAQLYSDFSRFTRADAAAATAEFLQLPMGAPPEQAAAATTTKAGEAGEAGEAVEATDNTRVEAPVRTTMEVPAAVERTTTTKPVAASAAAACTTTEAAGAARYSIVRVEEEGVLALEVHVPRVASLDGVVAEVAEHGGVLELSLGEVRGAALPLRFELGGGGVGLF